MEIVEDNTIVESVKKVLPYYRESVKKAIYKWRETHYDEFRAYASIPIRLLFLRRFVRCTTKSKVERNLFRKN